jgi:hypothetical protein
MRCRARIVNTNGLPNDWTPLGVRISYRATALGAVLATLVGCAPLAEMTHTDGGLSELGRAVILQSPGTAFLSVYQVPIDSLGQVRLRTGHLIRVRCRSVVEIEREISELLEPYAPHVCVKVAICSKETVSVRGDVEFEGEYRWHPGLTLGEVMDSSQPRVSATYVLVSRLGPDESSNPTSVLRVNTHRNLELDKGMLIHVVRGNLLEQIGVVPLQSTNQLKRQRE